jgi:hypothetical protein
MSPHFHKKLAICEPSTVSYIFRSSTHILIQHYVGSPSAKHGFDSLSVVGIYAVLNV